jgi:hypothetical protein
MNNSMARFIIDIIKSGETDDKWMETHSLSENISEIEIYIEELKGRHQINGLVEDYKKLKCILKS